MWRILYAVALLAAGPACAQAPDLSGWWRAHLQAGADTTDVYLHFDAQDGHAAALTIPAIRMEGQAVGPYSVADGAVNLPVHSWDLGLSADGRTLSGLIPRTLEPTNDIEALFTRTDGPPPAPAEISAPPPPAPVWAVELGSPIWAGLAYDQARNRIIAGLDEGVVAALDADDGREIWRRDAEAPIRAAPIVADGRIYAASDRALIALDARNGQRLWRMDFGAEREARTRWDHFSAAPVRADADTVVAAGRDGCVYAVEARDGRERWRFCTEDVITAAPVVAGARVLFGGFDGGAYALSLMDGALLWRRDTGGPIVQPPAILDGAALFGSRSYTLFAFDLNTGEERWRRYFWFSWVDAAPMVDGGTAYVGSSDLMTVQALSADGATLWAAAAPGWTWAAPAVGADAVYAPVLGIREYATPREGGLAAYDRETGALRWLLRSERPDDAEFYGFASAPILAGGRLIAADLTGRVIALGAPSPN